MVNSILCKRRIFARFPAHGKVGRSAAGAMKFHDVISFFREWDVTRRSVLMPKKTYVEFVKEMVRHAAQLKEVLINSLDQVRPGRSKTPVF